MTKEVLNPEEIQKNFDMTFGGVNASKFKELAIKFYVNRWCNYVNTWMKNIYGSDKTDDDNEFFNRIEEFCKSFELDTRLCMEATELNLMNVDILKLKDIINEINKPFKLMDINNMLISTGMVLADK